MSPKFVWSAALLLALAVTAAPHSDAGEKDKKDEKKEPDAKAALLKVNGAFTEDDPMDKVQRNSHSKSFPIKLVAGKAYRIDMKSKQVDPFLRLEDPNGKQVALNDDIDPSTLDSRIVYRAKADGEFKIIATTFAPGKTGAATGKFTLTVVEATPGEALIARVGDYVSLPAAEQKEVLAELRKHLEGKGADITAADAMPVLQLGMNLERGPNQAMAIKTYKDFGKLIAASSDEKVAHFGKLMQGAARRLALPGKSMEIKGTTVEDGDFDWGKYKGKVVLVDFWATWCGPCIGEIPNMKEMYAEYHDRGFEIVGISIDDAKAKPAEFMKARELPWVCLFDGSGRKNDGELLTRYGIFAIPQAILVGRDGNVISLNARGAELERLLEKHIGPREKSKKKADPNRDLE